MNAKNMNMNMNMKKTIPVIILASAMVAASFTVSAYDSNSHIYEAPVVSATPVYTTVKVNNPRRECWQEEVNVPVQNRAKSHTPTIFGAIIGAGIGNLFSSGKGRDAATVAGAVLGGSIGRDQVAKNQSHETEVGYEQRCEIVDQYTSKERFEGYEVTYKYNEQLYTTHTENDPGDTIKISVNIVPVE